MTTLRRLAVLVAAVSLILSGIALPAAHAKKGGRDARAPRVEQQHGHSGLVNKGKRARFVVVGLVDAVDADSVDVMVKGGTKKLRGTTVTVSVPEDTIIKGGSWADVTLGARIKIVGRRVEGEPVAWRVKVKRLAPTEENESLEDEDEDEDEDEGEDEGEVLDDGEDLDEDDTGEDEAIDEV